jgi:hypothetical protein
MRQAVAPSTPFTGEARGTQKARPVTFSQVAAALEKDPTKVVRSPNDRWHRQGYRLDGGGREAPGAFRVGDLYVVAPDYPIKGVPKLGEAAAPPKPSALPQATGAVSLPGTQYDEKAGGPFGAGRSYNASMIQTGDRTEIRDRKREISPVHAQLVTGHEVQDGDTTRRRETKATAGFGLGGNLFGAGIGRTDTTKVGDDLQATKGWQAGVGATRDEKINLNLQSTRELVAGTTPTGDPAKRSTAVTGGATYDAATNQFGANTGIKSTDTRGTVRSGSLGGTFGEHGSASLTGGGGIESKGGTSITTSLTAGTKVVAEPPVELPDGSVEVTYHITDSKGATVGGGQRLGGTRAPSPGPIGAPTIGAPTIGGSIGHTVGDVQGGVKRFRNVKEAEAWRKDAGAKIRAEQQLQKVVPPTTVAGALLIPVGETRSSGDVATTTMGISGSYAGTTIGLSQSESDTRQLSIRRVSANTVEVTGAMVGTKSKDASISVPVFSNSKGGIESKSFAVTWSFDLGTPLGAQGFERFCKTGVPIPGGTFKYMDTGAADEDHDNYKIPFVGTASWSGTTWEAVREDAAGRTQKQFGGKQSHQVKLGLLGRITGDDERASNAQIVRSSEDGEEKSARAELKVSGESGAFNRDEFGKIFSDKSRRGASPKPSGEWTLTAEVPMDRIRALEENNAELRNAMSIDDKMRIYAELVKQRGAQMLGGQVGMLSKSWDLQLKGDPNFPGGGERARLNQLRSDLTARLKANPGEAYTIAREAKETLDKLEKRLSADGGISDPKKYTDLPDGLRQQQIELVKQHIRDFTQVRQRALGTGIRGGREEQLADIQKRAGSKAGYDQVRPADRELARLQDAIAIKEKQIGQAFVDVRSQSKALGRILQADGSVQLRSLRSDEERAGSREAHSNAMTRVRLALALDPKQDGLKAQIQAMRETMDKTTDPATRLEALKPIDKAMGERLATLKVMIDNIQAAGAIIAPYASRSAMARSAAFWKSVGGEPAQD